MPTYRVEVLARDGSTAKPLTIEAPDQDAAKAIASDRGWIVGKAESIMPEMSDRPTAGDRDQANSEDEEDERFDLLGLIPLFSMLVIIVGIVWILGAWQMRTTSGDTYNIGMIANREASLGVGRTVLTCGVIGFIGSEIIRAIRERS